MCHVTYFALIEIKLRRVWLCRGKSGFRRKLIIYEKEHVPLANCEVRHAIMVPRVGRLWLRYKFVSARETMWTLHTDDMENINTRWLCYRRLPRSLWDELWMGYVLQLWSWRKLWRWIALYDLLETCSRRKLFS